MPNPNRPQHSSAGTTFGDAASKLAFFGVTPVVRQPANPDTSGATLVQLETEVNELKALLRAYGLLS